MATNRHDAGNALGNDLSASFLVEEAEDLAASVLATGLLVVHDTERGRQHDVSELQGKEKQTIGFWRQQLVRMDAKTARIEKIPFTPFVGSWVRGACVLQKSVK